MIRRPPRSTRSATLVPYTTLFRALLGRSANRSFNCITVDADTSTSDTVLLSATGHGAQHAEVVSAGDRHLADFRRALSEVSIDLATQVVKDGEGAQRFVTIDVTGAASARAARRVGLAIANSQLDRKSVV